MENILSFLKKVGELKNIKRQGVLYYGFKNADSATDHIARLAMMIWIFGNGRKLDLAKAFKLALVHDLCKVYTGDITPYDGLFPKNQNKRNKYEIAWRWRRLPLKEKQRRHREKFRKEHNAMKKLTAALPSRLKHEIMDIWLDYQKLQSPEAKFVVQVDRVENLLEALECWKKDKKFPTLPWWEHADEVIHDKELLAICEEISEEELTQKRR